MNKDEALRRALRDHVLGYYPSLQTTNTPPAYEVARTAMSALPAPHGQTPAQEAVRAPRWQDEISDEAVALVSDVVEAWTRVLLELPKAAEYAGSDVAQVLRASGIEREEVKRKHRAAKSKVLTRIGQQLGEAGHHILGAHLWGRGVVEPLRPPGSVKEMVAQAVESVATEYLDELRGAPPPDVEWTDEQSRAAKDILQRWARSQWLATFTVHQIELIMRAKALVYWRQPDQGPPEWLSELALGAYHWMDVEGRRFARTTAENRTRTTGRGNATVQDIAHAAWDVADRKAFHLAVDEYLGQAQRSPIKDADWIRWCRNRIGAEVQDQIGRAFARADRERLAGQGAVQPRRRMARGIAADLASPRTWRLIGDLVADWAQGSQASGFPLRDMKAVQEWLDADFAGRMAAEVRQAAQERPLGVELNQYAEIAADLFDETGPEDVEEGVRTWVQDAVLKALELIAEHGGLT